MLSNISQVKTHSQKIVLLKSLELSSVHPCTVFILLEHMNVTVLESIAMMSESMYQIYVIPIGGLPCYY